MNLQLTEEHLKCYTIKDDPDFSPILGGRIVLSDQFTQNERHNINSERDVCLVAQKVEVPLVKCLGKTATFVGTAGDDTIVGTVGPDVIHGLGGNDKISGLDGDDTICGGAGQDEIK